MLRINQRKVSKVEDATVMHKVNKVINVYQAEGVEMDTMSTATPSSLVAIHINGGDVLIRFMFIYSILSSK